MFYPLFLNPSGYHLAVFKSYSYRIDTDTIIFKKIVQCRLCLDVFEPFKTFLNISVFHLVQAQNDGLLKMKSE